MRPPLTYRHCPLCVSLLPRVQPLARLLRAGCCECVQDVVTATCVKMEMPDDPDLYLNFALHECLDGVTSTCLCAVQ